MCVCVRIHARMCTDSKQLCTGQLKTTRNLNVGSVSVCLPVLSAALCFEVCLGFCFGFCLNCCCSFCFIVCFRFPSGFCLNFSFDFWYLPPRSLWIQIEVVNCCYPARSVAHMHLNFGIPLAELLRGKRGSGRMSKLRIAAILRAALHICT